VDDVLGAITLSPLAMFVVVIRIFHGVTMIDLFAVVGFMVWACSIVLRVKRKSLSNHCTFIGAVLWSLCNLPLFWTFMSA
jgi:FtsH-binding integral membrane protein